MERSNNNRILILNYLELEGKMTISQLAKKIKVSRPTIYLHLDILEKKGLITRNKDKTKKGFPVTIKLCERKVKEKDKKTLIAFLKIIDKKGEIDENEMFELFPTDNQENLRTTINALLMGLISEKTFLTPKGLIFLKENSK